MTDRLRVLVNLTWLRPGEVGGSESYLTRLLGGVASLLPDARPLVHLAVQPSFAAAHHGLAQQFEVSTAPGWATWGRPPRVVAESTWLAGLARHWRADVVHHAGGTVPARLVGATAVTIHDLQYLVHPEYFSAVKLAFLRRQVPRAARRSERILVPSRYVAGMVERDLGVDAGRIEVVRHGLPPGPAGDAGPGPSPVDGPFLLYPAVSWPHKNHEVLLRALVALADVPPIRLVLTGGRGPEEGRLRDLAADLDVGSDVVWLGRVDRRELDALYRAAVALVFPSRFEGFGAPVIEAMRLGCPVIAADATALPEVVGAAGLLVDPDDVSGWAAAVRQVSRPEERERLVAAGLERASCFTADRAASELVHAWGRAASGVRA